MVILGFALHLDILNYGSLIFFAIAIGSIEAINDVAMPSILPEIAPKEDLAKNNGILSSTETATNYFLGRTLGSSVAAIFSCAIASYLAAFHYIIAAICMRFLTSINTSQIPSAKVKRGLFSELKEGVGYVWNEKNLRYLAVMGALGNAAFGAVFGTLILYATRILNSPEWTFGLLQSAFAIGSVLIGFRVGPIITKLGQGRALTLAVGVIPISFVATPLVPYIAMVIVTSVINGAAAVIWNTVSISYRQKTTPSHLLGRATAVFRMVSYGAMPVGSFLGGPIAEIWGLKAPYFVAAIVAGLNVLISVKIEKNLK
jgi:MFS family permease